VCCRSWSCPRLMQHGLGLGSAARVVVTRRWWLNRWWRIWMQTTFRTTVTFCG
jgi:hypothetical protein